MHTIIKITPTAFKFYNSFMGAINSLDRLLESYQIQRRTKSFWISFYHYYLILVTVNSFYLYQMFFKDKNQQSITDLKYRDQLISKLLSFSNRTGRELVEQENRDVIVNLSILLAPTLDIWVPFYNLPS